MLHAAAISLYLYFVVQYGGGPYVVLPWHFPFLPVSFFPLSLFLFFYFPFPFLDLIIPFPLHRPFPLPASPVCGLHLTRSPRNCTTRRGQLPASFAGWADSSPSLPCRRRELFQPPSCENVESKQTEGNSLDSSTSHSYFSRFERSFAVIIRTRRFTSGTIAPFRLRHIYPII